MARSGRPVASGFDAFTIEGALISPSMLAKIAACDAGPQSEADYATPKGLKLRDEIARYFRIGQALFREFVAQESPSAAATTRFIEALLRDVLSFGAIARPGLHRLDERDYVVTLEALDGRVPLVVVPPSDDLDRPSTHLPVDGRRRSAASAIQDWLNASDAALWGFCSNGERLRLVRDNASLTRPAYIEVDLRQIFEGEAFADFAALWLLVHASRFGAAGTPAADCALERWRDAGAKEGLAARDRLRDGVEAAILALGNGFLSHPANAALATKLQTGGLALADYFGELLRLVYRLIFLLAAEERGLLHPPDAAQSAIRLYAEGYSLKNLRDQAVRRAAWDRHHDRWEGLLTVFRSLQGGEKRLGLPALGGLFLPGLTPDLDEAKLSNRALMEAIFRLAWLKDDAALVPVNWRDMETEELGSVYESLLELTPRLGADGKSFAFAEGAETKGHARKTTGSYYTPDSLVQALLDSALDPVLDRVEAGGGDADSLLTVTVIDPACGSGHFLLAAARRIAARLARARAGGVASAEDYRHALRDVARSCIHGVDRNPMAVELTKVALWIETVEPGKPLGFLDASIRCGDALLGLFDLGVLRQGIPDDAFRPLSGDDKEAAKIAGRVNRTQREDKAQLNLALARGVADLARMARAVSAIPEDDMAGVEARARAYKAAHAEQGWWATKTACDLYIAAFLAPKHFRSGGLERAKTPDRIPTTLDVRSSLAGRPADHQLVAKAVDLAEESRAFHWPLEFPDVMARGGFDLVLGNPPWERIKLQEQEFFAAREPEIAEAPNAAARSRLIAKLKEAEPETRERRLYEEFEAARRLAEATSAFARLDGKEGGRFALTGRGDVNTYALFAELFASLVSPRGRAGVIVPTGIATDATTAPFFASLVEGRRLATLLDFENRNAIFPAVHRSYKFSLLTMGRDVKQAGFAFFLTDTAQLTDPERRFTLSPQEIARINPNTKTAPVFRSRADAELTAKIYDRVPVLIDEAKGKDGNPWGLSFARLFDMSNDSGLFRTAAQLDEAGYVRDGTDWILSERLAPGQRLMDLEGGRDARSLDLHGGGSASRVERYVPLYEAKMIHQFDHRWATYDGIESRDVTPAEKADLAFEPRPRYWVPEAEVDERLGAKGWKRQWLMGWRDICRSTDERTVISTAFPRVGVNHKTPLFFVEHKPRLAAAMLANWLSLTLDFVARQKIGGTSLTYFYLKQLAVLPPASYGSEHLDFLIPRVLELTYTSNAMAPFARDLSYQGSPFSWNENRRATLRAELDAFYARAYGLTRDELRYILDPADVKGAGYPSETFRVLKTNEIRKYGEYRTAKLALNAWDRMERGELK